MSSEADSQGRRAPDGAETVPLREMPEGVDPRVRAGSYLLVKRGMDFCLALALLVALSPAMAVIALVLLVRNRGRVFERAPRLGRNSRVFHQLTFMLQRPVVRYFPSLVNVFVGDMSLVGPRPAAPDEWRGECLDAPDGREHLARFRTVVRPGLICDFWLRRMANIAFDSELILDREYLEKLSFRHDVSVVLRAMPTALGLILFGRSEEASGGAYARRVWIQGIPLDNITMKEAIELMLEHLGTNGPQQVCYVNAHNVNVARRNPAYRQILAESGLNLPDGIGLKIAGRILGREIRENTNGTDLFPRLCAALEHTGKGLFLLGAVPGVPEEVAAWVHAQYPGVVITGVRHGYFTAEDEPELIEQIARSGSHVLLVAMGVPKQELWLQQHLAETGVKVAMGVGGLFDFYSGRVPRAPMWMRELGLEWVHRMWRQPGRLWKRYLVGNFTFVAHVLVEYVTSRRNGKGDGPST